MHGARAEREPVRRKWMLPVGAGAAAALLLTRLVVVLVQSRDEAPATRASVAAESPEGTVNARTEQVAARFLEAYGAFDLEPMMRDLADDAAIASLGAQDDPRVLIA